MRFLVYLLLSLQCTITIAQEYGEYEISMETGSGNAAEEWTTWFNNLKSKYTTTCKGNADCSAQGKGPCARCFSSTDDESWYDFCVGNDRSDICNDHRCGCAEDQAGKPGRLGSTTDD